MIEKSVIIPEHVNYLMTLIKSYEAHFRKNVGSIDINIGEIPILLAIYADEGLNQIDLVKKFHVTEANISKTTKNLLLKDLILKKIDSENNTKKLLFLTEKGQEVSVRLLTFFDEWKEEIKGDISNGEMYAFAKTLEKLYINSQKSF
ncbi:MarR family winged helix-turn-helix transcriptional regulator [Methanobrevibacter olleyae]|uniref:MarR family transcriptional regulator n=1 Tax=Methanobrevibacter olleyae TaxID=294671 RepID=A0A126QXS8_METOL|nr:MarR family winged helix-turn-helix transcriptional regulator [Methanobrevibacter olleyae]AMK14963.1 MarR family transcriptional regulator [Methanobrevibacter olleyae]